MGMEMGMGRKRKIPCPWTVEATVLGMAATKGMGTDKGNLQKQTPITNQLDHLHLHLHIQFLDH